MSDSLSDKKCVPCEGWVPTLTPQQISTLLEKTPGWQLSADGKKIHRQFKFKNFAKTMSFVNLLAWIADQQGHHPDATFGYNYCDVTFWTHAINGLSENDFICASKVNALVD